uniref:Beta-ketoacyl-[acyl-carrier-protein] synthase III n=1 Tax=Palmaria palmata TaxID=2822 RepID=A0A455TML1_PALPL|nr:3-oxoacyl-[acyl-carrier-protein] synthase 3 [Palmaria palmata]
MELSNMVGAHILATGSALPDMCISNTQLSSIIETSNEWISNRTGIKERRVVKADQSLVDLATIASQRAMQKVSFLPEDLDLIILATSTQDDMFGSASQLQASIDAKNAVAFDVTAACSGFVVGLITASQYIQTGTYQNILVVGADILSRWVDWTDRSTCILFGDGAGAAILQASKKNDFLNFNLHTDGKHADKLSIAYQAKSYKDQNLDIFPPVASQYNYLQMNGKEVYKFAVSKVPQSIKECLEQVGLCSNDVSWLLLHQANQRILDTVANKLSIPSEKIISNIQHYGNTSAASIPIALDEAFQKKQISKGDIIVVSGFGAGLTWGTIIIKWHA